MHYILGNPGNQMGMQKIKNNDKEGKNNSSVSTATWEKICKDPVSHRGLRPSTEHLIFIKYQMIA